MATDSVNITEDAEMAECDGDKVVTMMDVLQEQQDFEEDANAVLGASDDKNCTYSKGYIKRQALYACLTCCTEAKTDPTKRAGVCLACSLNCHENHELIELYTKRNFKCDCGNPKFNSHPCQFTSDKTDLNEENIYNQNFSGLYCTCQRPYPDPEATTEDDMIQCIICEDWLHSEHLEAVVPANDQYSEMICKSCMEKNEFLHDYSSFAVNVETADVDILTVNGDAKSTDNNSLCNGDNADKTETQISNVATTNGDTESITETKQDNLGNVESTETTDEKTDNVNEPDKMDVEKSEEDGQKIESTEAVVKDDSLTEQPDSKLEEEKTESGLSDETTKEQAETEEKDQSKDDQDKTEQQLLDDLSSLTDANPTVEQEKETTENKCDGNAEQSEDSKETKPEELPKENEGNTVDESEIEVPDTSQSEQDTKEKTNDDKDVSETMKTEDITEPSDKTSPNNETDDITIKDDSANDTKINLDDKTSDNNDENGTTSKTELNGSDDKVDKESLADISENSEEKIGQDKDINMETVDDNENDNKNEENTKEHKRKLSTDLTSVSPKKAKLECVRPKGVKKIHKGATFWPSNFRQKLCTCNECLSMYKDLKVLFLTDLEDTVFAYESLGKEKAAGGASQYEKGLEALSSLDRIQQINALTEYNNMRDKLLDFLKSFKDRKEIVKEEDIKAFFAGMKPRREPDGVYFCR